MMKMDVQTAALEYARNGSAVFPCNIDKRPITPHGFKDATTDPDTIRRWWAQHPDALIGSPTGNTEFVLDVDAPDGPASLAALEELLGALPPTREQATGGDGRQLFFNMPHGTEIKNSAGKIGVNLDIRAIGGYVILPPSLHKSGNRYKWKNNLPPADAPDWLIDLIISSSVRIEPTPATGDNRPGDDYNMRGDVRPLLERAGWRLFRHSGANEHWTRPGKNTGNSGTIFQDGSFYSFTGNAPPIESNKRYSRYALYALLEHNGDFSAAARQLAREGYGDQCKTYDREKPGTAPPKKTRLTFTPASELTAIQEPTIWLVKRFLEEGALCGLFAPPETLKTFVVLDMGLCIATGREWHKQKVKRGPVLYVCGEARRNIGRRITGWEKINGKKADGFFVSNGSAALLDPAGLAELEAAADAIAQQHGNPALIIIDTLNRNFGPGDENSTPDMTRLIAALDRLRERFKCAILIVHHTGLADAGRGRGNSALRGALDFEYCLNQKRGATIEDAIIELSCSKCKDHDRPPTIAFQPVIVDLGMVDEDLQPITSLILERTAYTPTQQKEKRLPPQQRIALEALRTACSGSEHAHLEEWRQAAYRMGIADSPDAKRKAFNRARTNLVSDGLVSVKNDLYSLPGQSGTLAGHVPECHGDLAGQAGHTPLGVSRMSRSRSSETVTVKI